jgi:hypothetical protein
MNTNEVADARHADEYNSSERLAPGVYLHGATRGDGTSPPRWLGPRF